MTHVSNILDEQTPFSSTTGSVNAIRALTAGNANAESYYIGACTRY